MGSIEKPIEDLVFPLSPLDHVSPRTHTPKLLYFASTAEPETIITHLQQTLQRTIDALPIIGGTVSLLKNAPQAGSLAVQAPYFGASDILEISDLRSTYSYATLRAGEFNPLAVDSSLVVPDLSKNPSRVLKAQVNLIDGGVILVSGVHHCVMDEAGMVKLFEIWSAFSRGADGSEFVTPACTDNSALRTGGRGTGSLANHPEYKLRPASETATGNAKPPSYLTGAAAETTSAVLFFSDASLQRLKGIANSTDGSQNNGAESNDTEANGTEKNRTSSTASDGSSSSAETEASPNWVSTNDALCALIWSAVTSARQSIGGVSPPYSMFNMALNGRPRLSPPLPSDFTGNVVLVTKAFAPFSLLPSPSVSSTSAIAAQLRTLATIIRKSVDEVTDKVIRDKIAAIQSVDDIGRLCPSGYDSQKAHMGCTSWVRQPYYEHVWGEVMGGGVKRLRWRNALTDGIFALFPRIPGGREEMGEGGVEVCIGLEKGTMERLKGDKGLLGECAVWRCA